MDQVHVVRHKVLVEGRTQRAVARELGISRVTVQKYLTRATPARYDASARGRPVWDAVGPRIEALLAESTHWTGGKQRLTATRLHQLLRAEGHAVGVTLVKQAVAEWRRQRREVMIPLTYRAGDLAEVDFFEVLIDVAGVRRKAWLFLLRLMYSGRDFGWIYERQDQISFLDGHVRAFAHLGVPARVAYDNLRLAVRRILVGGERLLTARFTALASHYLIEPCFCRPGEGHDKGGVEARGKAIRTQLLVPIPSGPTLAGINRRCSRSSTPASRCGARAAHDTIGARFAEEQRGLRPVDVAFVAEAATVATISPRALAHVEGAYYSVPCRWAGLDLVTWIGATTVTPRRSRRPADRSSADALRPAVDRLSALPADAGAEAASGPAGAARTCSATWAPRFPHSGPRCARRTARATPPGCSPRSWASSRPMARPWSCPALERALADRHAAVAGARVADAAARLAARRDPPDAPRRSRSVRGCAADYDTWLGGVA